MKRVFLNLFLRGIFARMKAVSCRFILVDPDPRYFT